MNTDLENRIWNSVPVSQQAFIKLLQFLDIEESRDISTAAVTVGTRSRLLINPDFIQEHCKTDDHLAMLVLHELFHVLLGHTRLYRRVTAAHNWAFDAVINAHLCLLFPEYEHTSFFTSYYKPDVFPNALLRPPEHWRSKDERWDLTGQALRVHKALYTETSTTYSELFRLLSEALQDGDDLPDDTELLGQYGNAGEYLEGGGADPDFLREVRNIVADWPMVEKRSGRDQGDILVTSHISVGQAKRKAVGVIRKALLPLLDIGAGGAGVPRPETAKMDAQLPYRTQSDRRAGVREALGYESLHYHARIAAPSVQRFNRAHIYLDVSGSMDSVLPFVYGALVPLLPYLHKRVHLFSTEITDIRPEQIRRGAINTTGGTEIDCVTCHMLENKVKRALLLTDGWVGEVPQEHATELRKRKVRVNTVITDFGEDCFAKAFHGKSYRLPKVTDEIANLCENYEIEGEQ